jgi:hypothetical protein
VMGQRLMQSGSFRVPDGEDYYASYAT